MTFLNLGKAAALLTHIDGEIAGKKKTLISWTGERGHIKAAAYFDFVPLKITSFKSPFVRSNTICSADWHWFHALLHFLKQARENLCCGRVVVTMSEQLEIQLSALCNVGGEYSNDKHSCTSLCINAAQVKIVDKCTGVIVDSNLQLHLSAETSSEATGAVPLCGSFWMGLLSVWCDCRGALGSCYSQRVNENSIIWPGL